MFSRTLRSFYRSLALRLTLWYAGIFAASSMLAFALVYMLMASILQQRNDDDLEGDIAEYTAYMKIGGLDRVKAEIKSDAQGDDVDTVFFRLLAADGLELTTSDLSSWPGLPDPHGMLATLGEADGSEPIFQTFSLPPHEYKVRMVSGFIAPGLVLQTGEPLEDNEEILDALLNGILIALIAVIALGGPIGWFMAKRALRGVQEITRTAAEIATGTLDKRVAVRSQGDELDTLAQTFNTMLDRIQALIVAMRQMSDNLAHDIRSPLGRIRAHAELALTNDSAQSEIESVAATTIEECDRLLEMVNTTLDIAEAEAGVVKLRLTRIDLVALLRDAIEIFQPVAEDGQVTIAFDSPGRCLIDGDRQRLQRVVANLLDNALKYTPSGGQVTLRLIADDQQVQLSIEDTGIGITAEDSTRIFERFYRGDRSRSEHGNGLGLSLAQAFVRAHGGRIRVKSVAGGGSTFTAEFLRFRDADVSALNAIDSWTGKPLPRSTMFSGSPAVSLSPPNTQQYRDSR